MKNWLITYLDNGNESQIEAHLPDKADTEPKHALIYLRNKFRPNTLLSSQEREDTIEQVYRDGYGLVVTNIELVTE